MGATGLVGAGGEGEEELARRRTVLEMMKMVVRPAAKMVMMVEMALGDGEGTVGGGEPEVVAASLCDWLYPSFENSRRLHE